MQDIRSMYNNHLFSIYQQWTIKKWYQESNSICTNIKKNKIFRNTFFLKDRLLYKCKTSLHVICLIILNITKHCRKGEISHVYGLEELISFRWQYSQIDLQIRCIPYWNPRWIYFFKKLVSGSYTSHKNTRDAEYPK